MPHLQFELTRTLTDDQRIRLSDWTTEQYARILETGTDHIAVSIREVTDVAALSLGRASIDDSIGLLNADVRAGRSFEQRHTFAQAVIERFDDQFDIPSAHCYVIYTEHPGEDFILEEGALESWSNAEADR